MQITPSNTTADTNTTDDLGATQSGKAGKDKTSKRDKSNDGSSKDVFASPRKLAIDKMSKTNRKGNPVNEKKSIRESSNKDIDNDPMSKDEERIFNNDDAEDPYDNSEVTTDKAKSVSAHQRTRDHVLPTSSNRMSKLAAHSEAQIYYHSLFLTLNHHE